MVVSTPPAGPMMDDTLERYFVHLSDELRKQRGPYVAVVDLRAGGELSPKQRQRLTAAMDSPEEGAKCVGTALVFSSALMRGMLTAILWVRKPTYETHVFATVGEAVTWGKQKVAASLGGRSIPPGASHPSTVR